MSSHRLHEMRLAQKASLAEVAKLLDVEKDTVSDWEHDLFPVPEDAQVALTKFYGVTRPFLMGLEEEPQPRERRPRPSAA